MDEDRRFAAMRSERLPGGTIHLNNPGNDEDYWQQSRYLLSIYDLTPNYLDYLGI